MYLLKIIIILSLILLPNIGYCSGIDWREEAIEHIRLNIILFTNITIICLTLLATMVYFRAMKTKTKLMSAQSLMDPLTNTLNRRGFHQRLDLLADKDGILLIADIDNFKSINDRFGHNTGDKVLRRVADTLHKQVRSKDIVSRYGGEEFFIFFAHQNCEIAKKITDRLITAIANIDVSDLAPNLNQVTISIGVEKGNAGKHNFEFLSESTDKYLYQAKTSGKNKAIYGFTVPSSF